MRRFVFVRLEFRFLGRLVSFLGCFIISRALLVISLSFSALGGLGVRGGLGSRLFRLMLGGLGRSFRNLALLVTHVANVNDRRLFLVMGYERSQIVDVGALLLLIGARTIVAIPKKISSEVALFAISWDRRKLLDKLRDEVGCRDLGPEFQMVL